MTEAARPAEPAAAGHAPRPAEDSPGRLLVQTLYAASRLSAMWGFESRLTEEAIQALTGAIHAAAAARGDVVLRFAHELVWLGDQRLRVDFSGFTAFRHIQERTARNGIGEISIAGAPSRADIVALLRVLEAKVEDGVTPDAAFDAARNLLAGSAATGVTLGPVTETDRTRGRLGPVDVRQAGVQAYFRLVFVAKRAQTAAGEGRSFAPRRCRRAVHEIVDVLTRGGTPLMIALAQVRNYHGFGPTHAANTCILACAVAQRAGMSKIRVADVGLAALLHELLPVDPSRTHAGALRERDAATARLVLRELGFGDGPLRAVLAARDLHAPPPGGAVAPSLAGGVIRACCFLDTVTTPAGADRPAESPAETLDAMARAPESFDPDAVQLLAAVLGAFPPGTVVRLDTGETGIVLRPPADGSNANRPVVRLLTDRTGRRTEARNDVDLAERDAGTGEPLRSITATRTPGATFETPADYVRLL